MATILKLVHDPRQVADELPAVLRLLAAGMSRGPAQDREVAEIVTSLLGGLQVEDGRVSVDQLESIGSRVSVILWSLAVVAGQLAGELDRVQPDPDRSSLALLAVIETAVADGVRILTDQQAP